ncbi:MAG: hypothetical protein QOH48_2206 [Actinomycetota bacterium]|nr:hypothetical protein [Actinomycetota bacterium]
MIGLCSLLAVAPARADTCGRVVLVTLPGVTWSQLARYRPPNLMRAVHDGAVGSMSVRTIEPVTTYADAFATIGAGARAQGGVTAGGVAFGSWGESTSSSLPPPFATVHAAGVPEIQALARSAGYGAQPGALGAALERSHVQIAAVGNGDAGRPPPVPAGFGRWSLLAAMDAGGRVTDAAVGPDLLRRGSGSFGVSSNGARQLAAVDASLATPCSVTVVDEGDLERADLDSLLKGDRAVPARRSALAAGDALVGRIRGSLDVHHDLLMILTPTSPRYLPETHLGVAIAVGPGFPAGTSLESASTRRPGFVTLPDVAPTVLSFLHVAQPSVMNGRRWYATKAGTTDRVQAATAADAEAVFVDHLQPRVNTGFVAFQVAVYLMALLLIIRRENKATPGSDAFRRYLEIVVLLVVGFPLATYLAGGVETHQLGVWSTVALLVAIDILLVAAVTLLLRTPLDRLLALTAVTTFVLVIDLAFGGRLQLSSFFGYSPIVAGRFAGLGNIGFAVLASSSVLTGALVVHRWNGSRAALAFAAALFVITIIADGAPSLGSDVGGVITLVPSLLVTWILLAGKRPTVKLFLVAALSLAVAVAIFLVLDLARPASSQTHLARLFEEFRARGSSALTDTIARKARANLQVFQSTAWTLFVPPALAAFGWLLLRPKGRWAVLVDTYPRLRAGLIGALLIGVIGFAANDSGIVIPAVVLSFFVPLAVLLHLSLMPTSAG